MNWTCSKCKHYTKTLLWCSLRKMILPPYEACCDFNGDYDINEFVAKINKAFQQSTMRDCHSISIEEYKSGAYTLWYNVNSTTHYVLHNFVTKPSKKELINSFVAFLNDEQNRIEECKKQMAGIARDEGFGTDETKPKTEVESLATAVDEIIKGGNDEI